jgi:thiamine pyrophosphokinase
VRGVTTIGLRYPLRDEDLAMGPPRGLSNVVDAVDARVSIRDGLLLLIETPATIHP